MVLLIEQILGQIQMTYFDREKKLANKVEKMDIIGDNNAKMADKMVYESVYSITSWSSQRFNQPKVGLN